MSGLRRGHVSIVCSRAMTPYFLPRQIALYQREFPYVSFQVRVLEHPGAAKALDSPRDCLGSALTDVLRRTVGRGDLPLTRRGARGDRGVAVSLENPCLSAATRDGRLPYGHQRFLKKM